MGNVSIKLQEKIVYIGIRHRRSVHAGIKYPCGQCEYQATEKGNLDKQRRSVHEGIKYPCGQCEYQATQKGKLEQHRRSVHEGI